MVQPGSTRRLRRQRPRLSYLVRMSRPFRHDDDADLIDGVYLDTDAEALGGVFLRERRGEVPDTFLLVTRLGTPAVHAEATLDADHRIVSYERLAALLYDPDDDPPEGVERVGERWDGGDEVVFSFETEDDALLAQG